MDESAGPSLRAALAYVARKVEATVQAEFEEREIPEATRSELLNEILLSDAGTSAEAASRLRRSDCPIDSSHCAVRIDCHEPTQEATTISSRYPAQQRIALVFADTARDAGPEWTRAGTASSILLLSSQTKAHRADFAQVVQTMLDRALTKASDMSPDLHLYIGVGTPHPYIEVGGIHVSVNEATTAVKAARDGQSVNAGHQFDKLGFTRALVRWYELDGVRDVIEEVLAPLLAQPLRKASESIATLRAYLDSGKSVSATADRLHLHRNTVRYRIDRIEQLLAIDLADPDERLLLELCCRVALDL